MFVTLSDFPKSCHLCKYKHIKHSCISIFWFTYPSIYKHVPMWLELCSFFLFQSHVGKINCKYFSCCQVVVLVILSCIFIPLANKRVCAFRIWRFSCLGHFKNFPHFWIKQACKGGYSHLKHECNQIVSPDSWINYVKKGIIKKISIKIPSFIYMVYYHFVISRNSLICELYWSVSWNNNSLALTPSKSLCWREIQEEFLTDVIMENAWMYLALTNMYMDSA